MAAESALRRCCGNSDSGAVNLVCVCGQWRNGVNGRFGMQGVAYKSPLLLELWSIPLLVDSSSDID
jgi:hypothetical protein